MRRSSLVPALLAGTLLHSVLVAAQPPAVLLQLRPRVGDTLRLRLDQSVEMAGAVRLGENESTSTESSTLVVLTRLVIEKADDESATVLAITDSVRLAGAPGSASGSLMAWAKSIEGQRFRFRVAPDGSTLLGKDSWGTAQVSAMISQMPATLPRKPIAPGTSWTRSMEIPLAGTLGARGTATLTASFQFDSLSKSGELAFLSVRGRLTRGPSEQKESATEVVETSGTLTGYVLVDRRRGWITDARTTMSLRSLVVPAGPDRPPMRVRLTISQWMRAM
jgi:hypothetical protein